MRGYFCSPKKHRPIWRLSLVRMCLLAVLSKLLPWAEELWINIVVFLMCLFESLSTLWMMSGCFWKASCSCFSLVALTTFVAQRVRVDWVHTMTCLWRRYNRVCGPGRRPFSLRRVCFWIFFCSPVFDIHDNQARMYEINAPERWQSWSVGVEKR